MEMTRDRYETLITNAEIQARVDAIASEITTCYSGTVPIMMPLLRGAFVFAADLARKLDLDVEVDFLGASSYGGATETSGEIRMTLDSSSPLSGRHVLIVEDIVDTGLTLGYIQKLIRSRGVASLRTAVLLDKQCRRKSRVDIDWAGFTIPDRFVFGYGLDGPGGLFRNLPDIMALPAE